MVAQMMKNLIAMQETFARSLGQEDPLDKGMAFHSSILAWRIPWIEEPDRLQFVGSQRVRNDWATNPHKRVNLRRATVDVACLSQSLSPVWLSATPWAVEASVFMGFPRQEYWSHFLFQGIFLTQELKLCVVCLLHSRQILYRWATKEAHDVNIKFIVLITC